MTCLSLVLTLALALQLGHLTTVAVYDGSAEKTCDMNKISVVENVDPSSIKGTWYLMYKSHLTDVDKAVDLIKWNIKYRSFTDKLTGHESFLIATWGFFRNNNCPIETTAYKVNTTGHSSCNGQTKITGRAAAEYVPISDADNLYKHDYYILGVDSDVLLFYDYVLYNGEPHADYSALYVVARDPEKDVILSEAMQEKLRTFCGPTAADISSFFQKCKFKYNTVCSDWTQLVEFP